MSGKQSIEAYAVYHRSKEGLAELTQIGAAAFSLLKLNVSVPNGGSLLGEFVDACNVEHWGRQKRFSDPTAKTSRIEAMFCRQILVQQISAWDIFTRAATTDLARFSASARSSLPELDHPHALVMLSPQDRWVSTSCCGEIANKFGDLRNRLDDLRRIVGWSPSSKLMKLVPLLDLARMARNRIVHSDSLIGSELAEFSKSKAVSEAMKHFETDYSRAAPPKLPEWKRGGELKLSAANAIFFGAVLLEFAKEINRYSCSKLTDAEFVEMAFYYGCLVETHQGRVIRMRDAEARIRTYLSERYLFASAKRVGDVAAILKIAVSDTNGKNEVKSTLWKIALQRHKDLAEFELATLPPNGPNRPKKRKPRDQLPV